MHEETLYIKLHCNAIVRMTLLLIKQTSTILLDSSSFTFSCDKIIETTMKTLNESNKKFTIL